MPGDRTHIAFHGFNLRTLGGSGHVLLLSKYIQPVDREVRFVQFKSVLNLHLCIGCFGKVNCIPLALRRSDLRFWHRRASSGLLSRRVGVVPRHDLNLRRRGGHVLWDLDCRLHRFNMNKLGGIALRHGRRECCQLSLNNLIHFGWVHLNLLPRRGLKIPLRQLDSGLLMRQWRIVGSFRDRTGL